MLTLPQRNSAEALEARHAALRLTDSCEESEWLSEQVGQVRRNLT